MNILILNLHSALNLGDDAIMQATLQALKESFPAATITAAANDPDSWRKYRDLSVVGSLTWWVIDRTDGHWRWRKPHVVVYAGLLALAVGLYRALNVKFLFGSAEQRRLLAAYYSADLVFELRRWQFLCASSAEHCVHLVFTDAGHGHGVGKENHHAASIDRADRRSIPAVVGSLRF